MNGGGRPHASRHARAISAAKAGVVLGLLRRNAQLRFLAIGFAVTQLGRQIGWIALVWWVLNGSRSPQLLGVLFVAYQLPALLSAPVIGSLVDRLNAKTIAVCALCTESAACTALAVLALRGTLTLPLLLALVVIFALCTPATLTYRRKLIGQITESADLPVAYAAFSLGSEASILIGPAAGGLLVGKWSVGVALCVFAAGTIAYLAVLSVSQYAHHRDSHERRFDLLEGVREIAGRPLILTVTLLTFFFFLAYGPLEVALPVAARVTFHTNAVGYGAMWSAYAVGSVAGLLLLRGHYQRLPTTAILCAIAMMWGILSAGLAFTQSLGAAMIVLLVAGFLWSPYNALESAFMQVHVPERVQGAVFSMQSSFLYMLAVPLGAMAGGWALAHTTPQIVMLASGAACVVAGIAGYAATARARAVCATPPE